MKKNLLLFIAVGLSFTSFAQQSRVLNADLPSIPLLTPYGISSLEKHPAARTTGTSDTLTYYNNTSVFSAPYATSIDFVSPADSGYSFGTNVYGQKGYAELYTFNFQGDTTFIVLGTMSLWHGTIQPTTTKTVNIKMWEQGSMAPVPGHTHKYYEGLPDAEKATVNVSVKDLGMAGNPAVSDTIISTIFSTAVTGVNYNFFVGYEISYVGTAMNGDTITLCTTKNGSGLLVGQKTISGVDTLIRPLNVIKEENDIWNDAYDEYRYVRNLCIVPIVQFNGVDVHPQSVQGITRNDLTFFGNYPNPAVNNTNIKFALQNGADVTITIMDINGKTLNTTTQAHMTAGEHIVNILTENLAAGSYLYLLNTSNGDAIASKMTIVK